MNIVISRVEYSNFKCGMGFSLNSFPCQKLWKMVTESVSLKNRGKIPCLVK